MTKSQLHKFSSGSPTPRIDNVTLQLWDARKINILLYSLAELAKNVVLPSGIPKDDNVLSAFDNYLVVRTNVSVEKAKFNQLVQNGERMGKFIDQLCMTQEEYCEHVALCKIPGAEWEISNLLQS